MLAAISKVECTNCGGGTDWITVVALGIAVVALILNLREHVYFSAQVNARAKLKVNLRVLKADSSGVVRMPGVGNMNARVEIGIDNTDGKKPATATVVNVLVPERTRAFQWTGPHGEPVPVAQIKNWTSERLVDGNGQEFPADYLTMEVSRVSIRTPAVLYFTAEVNVPKEGEGDRKST